MISIAMTSYNGEKYISQQLDSILNQSFTDFELIICDDCSSDCTRTILENYKSKDKRIKLFFNEKNLGFKDNFLKAIKLCSGEYIALCDQDDIWKPGHLETLYNLIGSADIACGNAEIIDENNCPKGAFLSDAEDFNCLYKGNELIYRLLCRSNPFQGASMLLKRSFIENENVINIPNGVLYHDAWFAACASLLNGINYTFDVVNLYRMHGNNASGQHEKKSFISRITAAIKKLFSKKEYITDRFIYIKELTERFPLSHEQKNIINGCLQYHKYFSGELKVKEKVSCLKWYWNNYKYILSTNSNKFRFIRFIKIIL